MIERLYVHNYRCLENFELRLKGRKSTLIIGKNGSGKSAVLGALEIFQNVGRNIKNKANELVSETDYAHGRKDVPIRIEIEITLKGTKYNYMLAVEWSEERKGSLVHTEEMVVNDKQIYSRNRSQITLHSAQSTTEFDLVPSLVALSIIEGESKANLYQFKTWLAEMILLAPIPRGMVGESEMATLLPVKDASNIAEWFRGLIDQYPAKYNTIKEYLEGVMPDISDIQHQKVNRAVNVMNVGFQKEAASIRIPFENLSDGEKCFFLCAVILAANEAYGPVFCFWDELAGHLDISEIAHFVTALRRSVKKGGQLVVTSHHPEAIRKFSDDNTIVFSRENHFEPTRINLLEEMEIHGDLIDTLIRGEVG